MFLRTLELIPDSHWGWPDLAQQGGESGLLKMVVKG